MLPVLPDLGGVRLLKLVGLSPTHILAGRFPGLEEFEAGSFDSPGLETFLPNNGQLKRVTVAISPSDTLGQQICSMKATGFSLTVWRGGLKALAHATSIDTLTLGMNLDMAVACTQPLESGRIVLLGSNVAAWLSRALDELTDAAKTRGRL